MADCHARCVDAVATRQVPTCINPSCGRGWYNHEESDNNHEKGKERLEGRKRSRVSPPQLIDARIKELSDWRGETLARIRILIQQADPEVVEERKWRKPSNSMSGVLVWSHAGMICTGEAYKNVVKMTVAKGAACHALAVTASGQVPRNTTAIACELPAVCRLIRSRALLMISAWLTAPTRCGRSGRNAQRQEAKLCPPACGANLRRSNRRIG